MLCPSVLAPAWSRLAGRPCRVQRVVQRLVQVQLADRVAVLVGLGAFDALAAVAGRDLLVAFALALAEVGEDLHQRLALHAADGLGREAQLALAVLVEHALLEELLEHLGLLGVLGVLHHLLDGLQRLLAILHDELHELVEAEELVLRGEFAAVVFAVEVLHAEYCSPRINASRQRHGPFLANFLWALVGGSPVLRMHGRAAHATFFSRS